nr:hypothetical protein Itr_chr13CG11080 [Ipomoea trifida]
MGWVSSSIWHQSWVSMGSSAFDKWSKLRNVPITITIQTHRTNSFHVGECHPVKPVTLPYQDSRNSNFFFKKKKKGGKGPVSSENNKINPRSSSLSLFLSSPKIHKIFRSNPQKNQIQNPKTSQIW